MHIETLKELLIYLNGKYAPPFGATGRVNCINEFSEPEGDYILTTYWPLRDIRAHKILS
jgi:hypothetical protein